MAGGLQNALTSVMSFLLIDAIASRDTFFKTSISFKELSVTLPPFAAISFWFFFSILNLIIIFKLLNGN